MNPDPLDGTMDPRLNRPRPGAPRLDENDEFARSPLLRNYRRHSTSGLTLSHAYHAHSRYLREVMMVYHFLILFTGRSPRTTAGSAKMSSVPVLTPRPATGPALTFHQLLLGPTNAALSGRLLLGILHPADEFVAAQGRDVCPGGKCIGIGGQCLAQVRGELVYHPARHVLTGHTAMVVRSKWVRIAVGASGQSPTLPPLPRGDRIVRIMLIRVALPVSPGEPHINDPLRGRGRHQ